MSNHGFVSTRKKLTPELVNQDIQEIVLRRFKGAVEVEFKKCSEKPPPKEKYEWWAHWEMKPKKPNGKNSYTFDFAASLMSHHKLDFRHPHGEWAWWGQMIVQDELAFKYNGTISDEGVEDRWKVTPDKLDKYKHFKDWVFKRWDHPGLNAVARVARKALAMTELAYTPEPLRSL